MRRWPRLKEHGITIWRLRETLDANLEEFGEAGFIEMIQREDRPDMAKVVGAIHLIQRRKELATLAQIAAVLDWPHGRVRTALSALEERRAAKRSRIRNPYRPYSVAFSKELKSPLSPDDFVAALDPSDPRDSNPPAKQPDPLRESPASAEAAERSLMQIQRERYFKDEAA